MTAPPTRDRNRSIWKFPLEITDRQVISGPIAKILSIGIQTNHHTTVAGVQLWAEVDTTLPAGVHKIFMIGTGHPMPKGATNFLGTVIDDDAGLVWHVYSGT